MAKTIETIWQDLKKRGAKEEEKEETIPASYITNTYKVVKLKDLEFEIKTEEDYDFLWDDLKEDNEVFLVNYHRDFWVEKNDIITKEEVVGLYNGEIDWKDLEREKSYWIFELACYVHSGVALQLGRGSFVGDAGGWDTSRVGLVLVSKKEAKTRKKAEKMAKNLVNYYNKLLDGEVYSIIIKRSGEEIDSIGGIVGELEAYSWIKGYIG
ncbi:hypothetical protein J7L36_02365 [bacterium]|nr:hypothetical protein [bacterium]